MDKNDTIIEILKKIIEIKFHILHDEELLIDDNSIYEFLNLLPDNLVEEINEELDNIY